MADILAVLYGPDGLLKIDPQRPQDPARDRFILSKGHACTSLYATLALRGFFPVSELESYGSNDTRLMAHASHHVPGVELSTGSLGHGLPVACGLALGAKRLGHTYRTVVMLSDGELDEGSNWEAFLFAGHHHLDNLTVIIDANGIQSLGSVNEVLDLEPLSSKFEAFGWSVQELDGHDCSALKSALEPALESGSGKPSAIIARTIKGKGVSFMENRLAWHYKAPNTAELEQALREVEGA
jgi:transketolase